MTEHPVRTLDGTVASAILAKVTERHDAIVSLAQELIALPSPTPPGDEAPIASLLVARMTEAGLRGARTVGPQASRRSVVWERAGDGSGPRVALAGHIDTKPVGDRSAWLTDPYHPVVKDGHLYGLGASDMKAAVAAMVHAASVVADSLPSPTGDIVLLLTADEEGGMRHGAHHLVDNGEVRADAIVIGEPAGIQYDWQGLHVLSRGMSCLTVRVKGTQMHSSLADVLPSRNASLDVARLIARFASDLAVVFAPHPLCPQGVTTNIGATVEGGVSFGTCSGSASFGVDIRFPPGVTRHDISVAVNAVLDAARAEDPGLDASWTFEPSPNDFMVPTEVSSGHPVVRAAASAMSVVLGRVPPLDTFPGATEAMVYQGRAGIPTLPALGPGCLPVCHGPNERVRVSAIHEAAAIYALLLADVSTSDGRW